MSGRDAVVCTLASVQALQQPATEGLATVMQLGNNVARGSGTSPGMGKS